MSYPGKMLAEVLRGGASKPATQLYPFIKPAMPANFRGSLSFAAEKCVGCKLCMKDCPAGAIVIVKVGEKMFEAQVNLALCIYCAQCVDSCNKDALAVTGEYELAALETGSLKVVHHAKSPGKPAESTP